MKQTFSGVATKELEAFPRDTSRPILLVGFLDQGNLGLGYLTATLRAFGYRVIVADVERPPEEIAALARAERPLIVGLSLIFQFYIGQYAATVQALRAAGIDAHVTMGGHFPSLSPADSARHRPGTRRRRRGRGARAAQRVWRPWLPPTRAARRRRPP